jgi:hypothetical protein
VSDKHEIHLYSFRKRDPLTGKWYRARYKATEDEIAEVGGIIDGPAEVRYVSGLAGGGYFRPYSAPLPQRLKAAPLDNVQMRPTLDAVERSLAFAFLRRLATYYTRRGRFAQAQGAAGLWHDLRQD